jgi:hypothetical protein
MIDKRMQKPSLKDFQLEIMRLQKEAESKHVEYIDIQSGDLHSHIGGYPGQNHRMPVCCQAMRQEMKDYDTILMQPPKGGGANLVIRYKLPR